MSYQFKDNHIELDTLPKKFKKLTGTRFASVLGLNVWSSPFEIWCAVTRTYEAPFEDTVYTVAGKTIEPKIINHLKTRYFMDLKDPTDVYGKDYFKKTFGDFYPDQPILGGMWDVLGDDYVVEIKTTKRAEDWTEGAPEYYKLQAALYAYLLGFDKFMMVVSFLEEKDYDDPESFEPNFKNTMMIEYSLSEEYPDFENTHIKPAIDWWNAHVVTGISPDFDEKQDAEILKILRKNTIEPSDDEITSLLKEADKLQVAIEKAEAKIADKKARLKEIDDQVKKYMSTQFRDGDKKVEIASAMYTWTLTRSTRKSVDSDALKKDGLYDKYSKSSETLTLKKAAIEKEEK